MIVKKGKTMILPKINSNFGGKPRKYAVSKSTVTVVFAGWLVFVQRSVMQSQTDASCNEQSFCEILSKLVQQSV